jgi:hypothetical protein
VAIQYGDADLELCDLTVEVPRLEALTQQFDTAHFCLGTAPAVVAAPSSQKRSASATGSVDREATATTRAAPSAA